MKFLYFLQAAVFAAALGPAALAQESDPTANASLAKKLQNPVAPLINVPIQNNFYSGIGENHDGSCYLLKVQPVIPLPFNKEYAVVSRTVLSYISQSDVLGRTSQSGFGDLEQSFFFTPMHPGQTPFKWGAGPILHFPTASDRLLGTEKWGAGPTGVILKQSGPWTAGLLANHLWSYAGNSARAGLNQTYFKPFLAYTFENGFSVNANMENTYNWKTSRWDLPFNAGVSKVFALGKQKMSVGASETYDSETLGGKWSTRLSLTLLFPEPVKKQD